MEELIEIAQKPKTDFALSLNMTPSGLSKILTGKRVPVLKERRAFTKQAADYFAEAIYSPKCYLKLEKVFPVIYDFESKGDLQQFLIYAIDYALDEAYIGENHLKMEYADRAMYYLGRKPVLNHICLLLSDYTIKNGDGPAEWFGYLPFLDPAYSKIFKKVILQGGERIPGAILNIYFDEVILEGSLGGSGFLALIAGLQKRIDLNFWRIFEDMGQSFLLLKGQFLLLFSTQIDGTPLLTPIFNKTYLAIFYNLLTKRETQKISYSRREVIEHLENNPDYVSELMNKEMNSVYNFISIGYLLEREELLSTRCSDGLIELIWGLLQSVLIKDTVFHVSYAAMERFVATGRAIVPLAGAVAFAPQDRASYLGRFGSYLASGSDHDKVKINNSDLNNLALFCYENLNIVYAVDDCCQREWFHVFHTNKIAEFLSKERELSSIDFSPEIWEAYQNALSFNFS